MNAAIAETTTFLTEAQKIFFHENGFLCLEQISPPDEVERLIGIYDRLFSQKAGRDRGAHFDMVGHDKDGEVSVSPQIINPILFAPELKETIFRKNALAIAQELLGPKAKYSFEHAIMKVPKIGVPTPWHQDEAFRKNHPEGYQEISLWMPLQPVDVDSGCLEYVAGSHRKPVLRHASPGNDPLVHALECVGEFDESQVVTCVLPAGGCVIHHCRTLHHSTFNHSPNPRRAYTLGFSVPPQGNPRFSPDFSWNAEKQTAHNRRKKNWRKKGGVLLEIVQKIKKRFQG